jgi:glycerol-3-phosphate acyltransferase PlsY
MILYLTIISLVLAYVAGSIPTAVWVGKLFHGIDVREHGSGNAGATNTIRVLGWKTGLPVMIVDLAKGWLGASLPGMLNAAPEGSSTLLALKIACGMAAIIGHVFPLMAGFRGGKGVATTFGVLLALHPALTLSCAAVFLAVLLLTGYVSLSSMTAGIMFPILLMTLFETPSLLFKIFSVLIAIALVLTHYKNIGRLVRGEEKRFIRKGKG